VRKLILNLAVSLDGFIEGPNGEFDWCFTDQDYGMKEFLRRIDTIFFGRKSYEVLLSMEKKPYPTASKYVFSRTLSSVRDATLVSTDIAEKVQSIKNEEGKNIWLFGGATLAGSLMNLGLVDELQLAVHPLFLGRGQRVIPPGSFNYSTERGNTRKCNPGSGRERGTGGLCRHCV
jgi:dihydrofolate reductase